MELKLLQTIFVYQVRYGKKDYRVEVLKDERIGEKAYGVTYESGHSVPDTEAQEIVEQFKMEQ